MIVTDGVTESADAAGDFYGEDRLVAPELEKTSLDDIFASVEKFSGSLAADDDCTVVDLHYMG